MRFEKLYKQLQNIPEPPGHNWVQMAIFLRSAIKQFDKRAEIIWEKGTNRSAFFKGEVDK